MIEELEDESLSKDKELESAVKLLKSYEKARDEGIASNNPELEALLKVMKQHNESSPDSINLPKVGTDRTKSETIVPKPFFVIKVTTSKVEKIFINICGSPKIPAPVEWEEGIPTDVEKTLNEKNVSECLLDIANIKFPVSCSDPVTSTDHGGKPCRVFDMVYNLTIVEIAMANKNMKLFLIETATTWISQKYNLELNSDFKLPNMKYKGGDVSCQQIRVTRTGPLVSEVSCDSNIDPSFPLLVKPQDFKPHVSKTCINELSSSVPINLPTKFVTQPDITCMDKTVCNGETKIGDGQNSFLSVPIGQPLLELNYDSRPVDTMVIMISYPQLKLEDLEIFLTYTQLLIKMKSHEPFEVSLPFCTELSAADASYDDLTGLLMLKLPFLSYCQALAIPKVK